MNWNDARLAISVGLLSQLPAQKPEIVFAGRSNVGKSSLLNRLTGRKSLARISSSPGKTTTINFYDINGRLYFVDLPGYGYAKRSKSERERWGGLIEGYLASGRDIRLVLSLVDVRHPPTADDRLMLEWLAASGLPYVVVATKCDKLSAKELETRLCMLREEASLPPHVRVIGVSSVDGRGREELLSIIEKYAGCDV